MHSLALAIREPGPAARRRRRVVHVVVNRVSTLLVGARIHLLALAARRSQMHRRVGDQIAMARVARRVVALLEGVQEAQPVPDFVHHHLAVALGRQRVPVEAAAVEFVLAAWVLAGEGAVLAILVSNGHSTYPKKNKIRKGTYSSRVGWQVFHNVQVQRRIITLSELIPEFHYALAWLNDR